MSSARAVGCPDLFLARVGSQQVQGCSAAVRTGKNRRAADKAPARTHCGLADGYPRKLANVNEIQKRARRDDRARVASSQTFKPGGRLPDQIKIPSDACLAPHDRALLYRGRL